jgi:hypothetical protein
MGFFSFFGMACYGESVPLPLPFLFSLLRSREFVPSDGACAVLLVSSLYRKLVLLFLIYILLTFDQKKKKKERALSALSQKAGFGERI